MRCFVSLDDYYTTGFSKLTSHEAKNHIGEEATVCGTVVIWGEDRIKFGDPLQKYKSHPICVEGVIDSYRGIPQIVARDPSKIRRQ